MMPLAIAAAIVLALLAVGLGYWIVSDELKKRRRERAEMWAVYQVQEAKPVNKHHGHAANAVTVPDLLQRAVANGESLRLAWADDDKAPAMVRGYIQDEYPTAVLPRIPEQPAMPLPVLGTESGLVDYYGRYVAAD